ncbi:MAG: hypothetical protein SGBAC_009958 [Bacillariaceae sp.]
MDKLRQRTKAALAAPKNAVRVEPKTYFANERTFIQWVSASLFLVTTSALMLEFENGEGYAKTTAKTLLIFALIIAAYALGLYYLRIWLMKHGRPYGYTSHFGPILLSGSAIAGTWIILSKLYQLEVADVAARNRGDTLPEPKFIQPEAGVCFEHDVSSFSPLEFEPSDALVDETRNLLLVPTLSEIYGFPLPEWTTSGQFAIPEGAKPTVVAQLERGDFESATFVENNLFAISEVISTSPDMAAVVYSFQRNLVGNFEVSGKWKLATKEAEGMTFIPQGESSSLYISGQQGSGPLSATIQKFPVPEPNGNNSTGVTSGLPALRATRLLNKKLLDENMEDPKIGSMQYFEGILYVLHDNARVVRSWDTVTGELLFEWSLPQIRNSNSKQWEGMALQRVQPSTSALRGSSDRGTLVLHLTHDTPAAIWSIVVEEGITRGSIILPECAGAP